MVRFSVFGIPVQVEPWFWVSMVLLSGNMMANNREQLLLLALFVLAGFISILVHELGHALVARRFGAWSEITLHAFGGYATYSGARMTRARSFWITAAGPGFQLILAGIVFAALIGSFHLQWEVPPRILGFAITLIWISVFWAVLNLVPVLPLDGGQILDALMGPQRRRTTLWVSIIAAIVAGVIMFNFSFLRLFPILLGWFAWQSWQELQNTRSRWR